MKTHEWSPGRRYKALGLIEGGRHSLREITNITNIPKGTLGDLKKRNTGISKPRSGRPKTLSSRDLRHIEIYIRTSHTTRRTPIPRLISLLDLQAHPNTVRKALIGLGYNHRVARRCPFLNKCDRKRRLQYAKRHAHWTVEDWAKVIFTDEMSIKLYMERHSKDLVWRKVDEELHPDCIAYHRKPTGTGMMFWGAFRKGRMGLGVFFELEDGQNVNSTIYRDQILLGPLKDFWEESFGDVDEPVVMEDNAPAHKKVCIPARKELGMICHQHPPNSPDLNPIENIWSYMKDIIAKHYSYVSSEETMKEIVRELWDKFADNRWDSLIASMPERMQEVIKAKGGSTHF